jgi:hypothetical protein
VTPFVADGDFTLFVGDALNVLRDMPDESVHCVVTSPPYWGLRDYGTGSWAGGDPDCDHRQDTRHQVQGTTSQRQGRSNAEDQRNENFRDVCGKCGATRTDQQLGLEPTPDAYIERMVQVFREVRRVLRRDGTCWLNIGDSYNSIGGTVGGGKNVEERKPTLRSHSNLKHKDMCGIPWRLAFALQQPYYTGRIKDERERIWLAAMVEAEGCMFIHRRKAGQPNGQGYERKSDSFGAGLEVSSTDRALVERCMEIAGIGSVCEQTPDQNARRKQTIYRWNARTNACRDRQAARSTTPARMPLERRRCAQGMGIPQGHPPRRDRLH